MDIDPDMTAELSDVMEGSIVPSNRHAPPNGAIASARKFLWDEDEEEETEKEIPIRPIDWKRPQTNFGGSHKSVGSNSTPPPPERYGPEFGIAKAAANPAPALAQASSKKNKDSNDSNKDNGRPSLLLQSIKSSWLNISSGMQREKQAGMVDANKNIAPRKFSKDAMDMNLEQVSLDHSERSLFSGETKLCSRKRAIAIVLICFAVTMTIVAVITTRPSNPFPFTNSDKARTRAIQKRIVQSGISKEIYLNKEGTPQHQALTWIALNDGAKLDVHDDMLLQRYTLAVFFFSTYTNSDQTSDQSSSSSSQYFPSSEPSISKATTTKSSDVWKDATNWMSSKGYCSWKGIRCHHRHGTSYSNTRYDDNGPVTHLDLADNNLRGKIPNEIGVFQDLRLLHLAENELTGTIPLAFGYLHNLVSLNLASNRLIGRIPTTFGDFQDLTHLYLQKNELGGEVPVELNNVQGLQVLSLYSNNFRGEIPDFTPLKQLEELYLDDNNFNGRIPPKIGQLSVHTLRLNMNWLTGTLPKEIGDMENLEHLYIDKNELTGTLPTTLGKLNHLEKFHAFDNQFTGQLPYHLGSLENLQVLYLDNNKFSGTIPHSWGGSESRVGMQDLQQLYLYNNQIKGKIPPEIGKLEDLRSLQLHDNQITGTIPPEMGNLYKLKYAYLDNNKLQGEVPGEIGKLSALERLRIDGNDITGEISDDVCSLREGDGKLKEFHSDCDGNTPEVECACCTSCF